MHEFSIYGQVIESEHHHLLQQLAGICRMQPKPIEELHLVFLARPPPGLSSIPSSGEASTKQDVQRIAKMLTANTYVVHVIGEITRTKKVALSGDAKLTNGNHGDESQDVKWFFEFKDIPDAGKQPVNAYIKFTAPMEDGDIIGFMKQFGYDYVNRYAMKGHRLYDQDTTLSLQRIYRAPATSSEEAMDWAFMNEDDQAMLLDQSGSYYMQASIEAADGSIAELKDRATSQLLALRDTLKPSISLAPVDRLALDRRASSR